MRTLGCRSKSAVFAGCVAQLSKEKTTWDVAMMPLTITDSLKHRKAFDEAQKKRGMHAAQDELYVALCQEGRESVRKKSIASIGEIYVHIPTVA